MANDLSSTRLIEAVDLPQEPLTPSILACLEHRHSFVRRNAVLAINALYKLPKGEMLLQDAPELIEKVLQVRIARQGACRWLWNRG